MGTLLVRSCPVLSDRDGIRKLRSGESKPTTPAAAGPSDAVQITQAIELSGALFTADETFAKVFPRPGDG